MSRYCENNGKKKASATAKTALGLAIGGLGLAAVQGGVLGGNGGCCGGGGLLGNLFGGNRDSCCCEQQRRIGEAAVEEINMLDKYLLPMMHRQCEMEKQAAVNPLLIEREMVDKYIMPIMHRTCNLEKETAVHAAVDEQRQIIQGLLFKLNEQGSEFRHQLGMQDTDAKFTLNRTVTDAEFALGRALTKYDIEKATCNVVRGKPFISPCQMADPYNAGQNILLSRHVNTYANPAPYNDGCGCGCGCDGAWSGLS